MSTEGGRHIEVSGVVQGQPGAAIRHLAWAPIAVEPDESFHLHRDVPPGDGGIALGQALVADAIVRRGSTMPNEDIASRENVRCA